MIICYVLGKFNLAVIDVLLLLIQTRRPIKIETARQKKRFRKERERQTERQTQIDRKKDRDRQKGRWRGTETKNHGQTEIETQPA